MWSAGLSVAMIRACGVLLLWSCATWEEPSTRRNVSDLTWQLLFWRRGGLRKEKKGLKIWSEQTSFVEHFVVLLGKLSADMLLSPSWLVIIFLMIFWFDLKIFANRTTIYITGLTRCLFLLCEMSWGGLFFTFLCLFWWFIIIIIIILLNSCMH